MKGKADYILKIFCKRNDSEILNELWFENGKNFTLECLDFGSHLLLFKNMDDVNVFKSILEELSYPELCHEILVTINSECIAKRKLTYEKEYSKHSNWLDFDVEAWSHFSSKWQVEIRTVVNDFNKVNEKIKINQKN